MINIKPSLIILPLIVINLLLTLITPNASLYIMTIFIIIYPAYMTFEVFYFILQAIHNEDNLNCKKWLAFWLIFGFFTTFNGLLRILLFFVPSYYSFRFLFFLWLFYPRTNGITIIYEQIVEPYAANIKNAAKKLLSGK